MTVFRLGALSRKGSVHDPAFDAVGEQSIAVPRWMPAADLGERD